MTILSRRKLLGGQWRQPTAAIRPPWSRQGSLFITDCTRCQACVRACETGVLISGSGGFPEIDFQRAECTFCGRCAQACAEPVFRPLTETPWRQHAVFGTACLAQRGVECRSCQDSCEPQAIRFRPHLGEMAQPVLDAAACNGCGACVAGCPTGAVTLTQSENNNDE
ncbi:ferredoxin-type protein [Serratia liquefaciens]|uniref:ferredoxin-type protein NapF n=1 Tax=Serratia liquefaciens TaxID=614 RepID=UPI0021841E22|nr:ferredoxin-type protein NapF [Serratia liquefaciens]CAI2528330.1 ferredoxin-type protein [Serratia liquefaciens]